ncbi:hypothetical protein [Tomitella biformata]|uniref:hypothetical protein n=1 Tax=Tomitella biformata TaxID=630403 RepID=UPI000465FC71|nr:hypothetical protein [Tomitella biformata]
MDQAKPEKPVDIRTAFELWCAVAVLGVFASIALVFVTLGDRAAYTEELTRRLNEMDPSGAATVDISLAFNLGLAIAGLFGVAIAVLVYFLARQLRAGKGWARLLLTGATAFVVVSAISSFAAERQSGIAPMALAILMILQAVLAVGATVLSHRRDASVYLAKRPTP